jgi:hypothetical protein
MRLVCQKVFLLTLVVTLACHDGSTTPRVFAGFTLVNINGRTLPTFVSPIPEAPSVTSGSLVLYESGRAVMTEHKRDQVKGDLTVTMTLGYTITGDKIETFCLAPSPGAAACMAGYAGTISGLNLSLTIDPSQPLVYNYFSYRPD